MNLAQWIFGGGLLLLFTTREVVLQSVEPGVWGPWGNWTECTRPCGTGVHHRSRDCFSRTGTTSPSVEYECLGTYKNIKVCNRQACPADEPDFRTQQCRKKNNDLFRGRYFQWKPYKYGLQSCILVCEAERYGFHTELERTVIDGTPCGVETGTDVDALCVEGQCRKLGCDGELDSTVKRDQCGKCGGDGTSCTPMQGTFTKRHLKYGYNKVVTIPAGAYKIKISTNEATRNFLGLRSHHKHTNILNMGWQVVPAGKYNALGTTFEYSRRIVWGRQAETITADAPITHALDVMLLHQTRNLGVSYFYIVPQDGKVRETPGKRVTTRPLLTTTQQPTENNFLPEGPNKPVSTTQSNRVDGLGRVAAAKIKIKTRPAPGEDKSPANTTPREDTLSYQWRRRSPSSCSVSCGGGTQHIGAMCVDVNRNIEVIERNCVAADRPQGLRQPCNTDPCPPRWVPGEWSPCSTSCGPGTQTRKLNCKRILGGAELAVASHQCDMSRRPDTSQVCKQRSCAQWKTHKWSQCSATCGSGRQTRQVVCVDRSGRELPASHCPELKPDQTQTCDRGTCGAGWYHSHWIDRCTESCSGNRKRSVICVGGQCDNSEKPRDHKWCHRASGCDAYWFARDWEPCSSKCGDGTQKRAVVCLRKYGNTYRFTGEHECDEQRKPATERFCSGAECPGAARWMMSEWSKCEGTCSRGVAQRVVRCLDTSGRESSDCVPEEKPHERKPCVRTDCEMAESPDAKACQDRFKHCEKVVEARLCRFNYYNKLCCRSCDEHERLEKQRRRALYLRY